MAILAAMAEHEAGQTSQPTKDALKSARRKGFLLGSARPGHWDGRAARRELGQQRAKKASAKVRSERANEAYAFLMPMIREQREHGRTLAILLSPSINVAMRHLPASPLRRR